MQKFIAIGNLTNDPELKTANNKSYAKFGLAVPHNQETQFFDCVAFGDKMPQAICRYLKKGKKVAIFGFVKVSEYEKDGVRKKSVGVVVENIEFLSPRDKTEKTDDVDPFVQ